jgi:hypothetical protein
VVAGEAVEPAEGFGANRVRAGLAQVRTPTVPRTSRGWFAADERYDVWIAGIEVQPMDPITPL